MAEISFDFSDPVPLSINVKDLNGNLADAGAVTLTITLPNGTSITSTPLNPATGVYQYDYQPTMAGRHVARWVATGANASSFVDTFDVRLANPDYLVSLADVKRYLNILTTTNDEELRGFIEAATGIIEDVTGPVVVRSVAETHTRPGRVLVLRSAPVVSLTSITSVLTNSGLSYDVTALDVDTDTGIVRRIDGLPLVWRRPGFAPTPVRIVYTAGRPVVPAAITMAAQVIIDHLWETQRGHTQGVRPVPGGGRSQKKGPPLDIPFRARELLRPYRRSIAIF